MAVIVGGLFGGKVDDTRHGYEYIEDVYRDNRFISDFVRETFIRELVTRDYRPVAVLLPD